MSEYSIKMPDMGRNEALAGRTVYDCGMNVHYDQYGYAVWAENPDAANFKGTTMSVHAQPKADALEGKPFEENWAGLVYWNGGNPDYEHPLTEENEAAARKEYAEAVALRDRERRGEA